MQKVLCSLFLILHNSPLQITQPAVQKVERAQITSTVVRVPGAQKNPVLVQLEAHNDGSGLNESLSLTAKPGDSHAAATITTGDSVRERSIFTVQLWFLLFACV